MSQRSAAVPIAIAALSLSISCSKKPVADAVCTYQPLAQTAEVPAKQGGIQVVAATDDYFHLFDGSGKEVQSGPANHIVAAKPGDYTLKLNSSSHPMSVAAGTLSKCRSGTLLVVGSTDEWYHVSDGTDTELASQRLGKALAFFPGTYSAAINKTPVSFTVKPGETTRLTPGLLNVRGSTDEYYHVLDANGTELTASKLSHAVSLFPAKFTVKVNGTTAPVTVAAGAPMEMQTGALMVHGTTEEYYHVFNSLGVELTNSKLNQSVSLFPGTYSVKINNTAIPVTVDAAKANEYQTATLTVKRAGDEYYHVFDTNGTELGNSKLNQPMALAAGNYSVKLGSDSRPVTLTAGQATVVNW
jgi:hypothetical protein